MRRYALPLAAALALIGAAPVLAGAGLPKIATLQVGPYSAAVHNDSTRLVAGRNTLTVEVADLPSGHAVTLSLVGAGGQQLPVPLRPVQLLDGPAAGHDEEAADVHEGEARGPLADTAASTASPPQAHGHVPAPVAPTVAPATRGGDAHAAAAGSHAGEAEAPHVEAVGQTHAGDADSHVDEGVPHVHAPANAYLARGVVSVPGTGTWTARLAIQSREGLRYVAEAPIEAVEGGPNSLYVPGVGGTIAAFLLYGAVARRRTVAAPALRAVR